MPTPPAIRRTIQVALLAGLFCGAAPAAMAQAVPTASGAPSGISQEQALALAARLDAIEKRNEELEDQITDLKAQTAGAAQTIREAQAAQPVVTMAARRSPRRTGPSSSRCARSPSSTPPSTTSIR
jgi:uncharacterized protein YlxW (UPF0749 family)